MSLCDLLSGHVELAVGITRSAKVLPFFYRYLEHGHYPFYKEVYGGYGQLIEATINQILEND